MLDQIACYLRMQTLAAIIVKRNGPPTKRIVFSVSVISLLTVGNTQNRSIDDFATSHKF